MKKEGFDIVLRVESCDLVDYCYVSLDRKDLRFDRIMDILIEARNFYFSYNRSRVYFDGLNYDKIENNSSDIPFNIFNRKLKDLFLGIYGAKSIRRELRESVSKIYLAGQTSGSLRLEDAACFLFNMHQQEFA